MNVTLRRATRDDLSEALTLVDVAIRECFPAFASPAGIEAAVQAKRAPEDSNHYFGSRGNLMLACLEGRIVGCLGMQFHFHPTSSRQGRGGRSSRR